MIKETPMVKSSNTGKNVVLALLLLFAIALAGWNGIATTAVSRQKQVNLVVQTELDATRLEHKAFKELQAKRKAAVSLLEARRSTALQRLARHTQQATSMMSICESPEEIIPVFPNLIQSVILSSRNGRRVDFYVPPGEHQLIVRSKFMIGANFNDLNSDEDKEKAGFETHALTLRGGNAYSAMAVLENDNEAVQSFDRFNKVKVVLKGAGDERSIGIKTPISEGSVGSRGTRNGSSKLVLPNAILGSFYPNPFGVPNQRVPLAVAMQDDLDLLTQIWGIRPNDSEKAAGKKAGLLMIQFSLRSSAKPSVLPTDRFVMGRLMFRQDSPEDLQLKYNPAKIRYEVVK